MTERWQVAEGCQVWMRKRSIKNDSADRRQRSKLGAGGHGAFIWGHVKFKVFLAGHVEIPSGQANG